MGGGGGASHRRVVLAEACSVGWVVSAKGGWCRLQHEGADRVDRVGVLDAFVGPVTEYAGEA